MKFWKRFLKRIGDFIAPAPDKYVTIPPAPLSKVATSESVKIKSSPINLTDLPTLGPDHNELLEKAARLHPGSIHNQYHWLLGVHRLRNSETSEWILDPMNVDRAVKHPGVKKFDKWGLTHTTAGI